MPRRALCGPRAVFAVGRRGNGHKRSSARGIFFTAGEYSLLKTIVVEHGKEDIHCKSGRSYPSSVVKKYCVGILHEFTQSPVQPLVSR